MNARRLILRETAISAAINAVLSVLFFLLLFGLDRPAEPGAFGRDFVPQAFMVALMGTLVPGLLLRRKVGGAAAGVVTRSLLIAVGAAVIAGGLAMIAAGRLSGPVPPVSGLLVKAAFGAALALVVTPPALRAVLARRTLA